MSFRIMTAAALVAGLVLAAPGAYAMGSASSNPGPDYAAGAQAAKDGRYRDAIELLTKVVRQQPDNADAHNYLGYSHRKLGELDKAREHYRVALQIDPYHLGALEYYGELFLDLKDLPRAEEQLGKLVKLCPQGCVERSTLEKAVASYKSGS